MGHNVEFDKNIVGCEFLRIEMNDLLSDYPLLDTMKESTEYCQIPGRRGGGFKWPSLTQLHEKLFGEDFDEAHNASADVEATTRCFLELVRLDVISAKKAGLTEAQLEEYKKINTKPFDLLGLDTQPYQEIIDEKTDELNDVTKTQDSNFKELKTESPFSHLHLHTQYSVLQASSDINEIVSKSLEMQMPAVAITDMYNMFGVFKFLNAILNHPDNQVEKGEELKLKPILSLIHI